MAGDHDSVLEVVQVLTSTRDDRAEGHRAAAGTLQRMATGAALHEAAGFLDSMEESTYVTFRQTCLALGPNSVDALRQTLMLAQPVSPRLVEILRSFGDIAVGRLAPLAHHPDPATHIRLAGLLSELASSEGLPTLELLLRSTSSKVSLAAMRGLLTIGDPQGVRTVFDYLRDATAELRPGIVVAITECQAPDSGPLLVQILLDSQPLGDDHRLVLDILTSLRRLEDPRAVAGVARVMRQRRWLRPSKTRTMREQAIDTLLTLPGERGRRVVTDVTRTGDWQLRRLARTALRQTEAGGTGILGTTA